jgi:NADPH:quinone reductase-like Zn-dependent oxidoreductase
MLFPDDFARLADLAARVNRSDAAPPALVPPNPDDGASRPRRQGGILRRAQLEPGDWSGLTIANSGVGQFVIGLATRAGVKTLAIVRREEAAEQVRALGAD